MEPEVYFLKYALPCSHILFTVRKEVSKEEFDMMKDAASNDKVLSREFLERVFFRAFDRIKILAGEMGKDKWDFEVIKEYFRVRHNPVLDKSDYPESFKDMCRVYEAKVLEIQGGEMIVEYGIGTKRKVKKDFVSGVGVGDKVTIHWSHAVEKV